MGERVRVQVEIRGIRVWVAIEKNATLRELMSRCESIYEKQSSEKVCVGSLSLRGALLDPDEKVGEWIQDQELLFAESAESINSVSDASAAGVLVAHEPPLNSEHLRLATLEPRR